MPTRLIDSTAQAASLFAAGGAVTAGVVSAEVAALTGEVLKIMLLVQAQDHHGSLAHGRHANRRRN